MSSEMQFCPECNNLLQPREDVEHRQLMFLCRSCEYLQYADPADAEQNCVDRQNFNFRSKEDVNSYIAQGLGDDPTLPRQAKWTCPNCPSTGAVFFQLPERVADDAMTLVFVCTACTYYEVKGKEADDEPGEMDAVANSGPESLDVDPRSIKQDLNAYEDLGETQEIPGLDVEDQEEGAGLQGEEDEPFFGGEEDLQAMVKQPEEEEEEEDEMEGGPLPDDDEAMFGGEEEEDEEVHDGTFGEALDDCSLPIK